MKRSIVVAALALATWLMPTEAEAGKYILYYHGRSMGGWPGVGLLKAPAGWSHIAFTYDGSERVNNSTVRSIAKNGLKTYCRGSSNECVVVCYSAGCIRVLKALDELVAAGTPANKILWIEATASAAGGSEVANYTTKWWKKLIVKLFGQYAKIDEDLRPTTMRGTFGYIQNRAPVSMYHSAGKRNMCQKFLGGLIKLCGNSRMPGGYGDGAVPAHSACGYAAAGSRSQCCLSYSKYTNRQVASCALHDHNHTGMLAVGVISASLRLGQTKSMSIADAWAGGNQTACDLNWDDCDMQGTQPTLPGILNVTPADSDLDGKPDNCYGCDAGGCARCREFTLVDAGYPSFCNGLSCTPTMTFNSSFSTIPVSYILEIKAINSTTIRIYHCNSGSCRSKGYSYVYLNSGVTVSGGGSLPRDTLYDVTANGNNLNFHYKTPSRMGYRYYTTTLTFSGAQVFSSEDTLGNPTGIRVDGNQLIFTGVTPRHIFTETHTRWLYVVDNQDL